MHRQYVGEVGNDRAASALVAGMKNMRNCAGKSVRAGTRQALAYYTGQLKNSVIVYSLRQGYVSRINAAWIPRDMRIAPVARLPL